MGLTSRPSTSARPSEPLLAWPTGAVLCQPPRRAPRSGVCRHPPQARGAGAWAGGEPSALRPALRPQAFLTKVWWGQLCVDTGLWRVILCMLAFPLLATGLVSFRCGPDAPAGAGHTCAPGCGQTPEWRGAGGREAGEGSHPA